MLFGLFGRKRQDINLIPEEERKLRINKIRILTIFILSSLIIFEIAVFSFLVVLTQREKNAVNNIQDDIAIQTTKWESVASKATAVKSVKSKLASVKTFENQSPSLNDFVNKIKNTLPKEVDLTSINTKSTGESTLEGSTSKPNVILQLFEEMSRNQKDFSEVTLSAVNIGADGGFTFIIDFNTK